MLHTIPKEAAAYSRLYHGKRIGLKVGGGEIESADFPTLVDDVQWLIGQDIRVVLAYGGGNQISRHYGKPREKVDGVGVTTPEVLREGVLPAYREVTEKFRSHFPDAAIAVPADVRCDPHPDSRFGLVGVLREIVVPDEAALTLVGFVGTTAESEVNVNTDDVALTLARQFGRRMNELIFLTSSGGVYDVEESIVPLLTDRRIERILAGQDPHVRAGGGMRKKLMEAARAVKITGKVAITSTAGLRDEIEKWMGSGTLCVDSDQLRVTPMHFNEESIFDTVFEEYAQRGIFRPRTPEELDMVKKSHLILRAGNSPLGGMSLIRQGRWLELSTVWAGAIGNGVGQLLLNHALLEADGRRMYALSTDRSAINSFSSHPGFRSLGSLSEAQTGDEPDFPEHLRMYDTTERDPWLFVSVPVKRANDASMRPAP